MYSYQGKLLFVDLSTGEFEVRELDEKTARAFLGGPSLGAKILYDEMPAHTDPFAEESVIGYVTGALNGTGAIVAGRYTVVAKSPVYNGWNDANSGGLFGLQLRKSGFDGIFIKGISPHPVYLFVDDGKFELRDAAALWGLTSEATEHAVREELEDPKVGVALIGPAGERKSHISAVMNDAHRAAGRGGVGSVMGSKNLKAIAVRGNAKLETYDKEGQIAANKMIMDWMNNGPLQAHCINFKEYGTGGAYMDWVLVGDGGVKNWAGAGVVDIAKEKLEALCSQPMDKKFRRRKYACSICPVGCGAIYHIDDEEDPIEETSRPEYETMGQFGSLLLNGDDIVLNRCNFLCNEYGFDTISAGGTIAWAMECYDKGFLSAEELDGIELKWGDGQAILAIMEKMCKGEGVGAVLQHGSQYAADHFGKGHAALVVASGIEIPEHDARFSTGLTRTYKYDPTPGRHVKGGLTIMYGNEPPEVKFNYTNTGPRDLAGVIHQEIVNAGGYCQFSEFAFPAEAFRAQINATTGFDYSEEEFDNLGKRSYIMRHAFNIREGKRRGDWTLSDRIAGKPPLTEGPLAGVTVDTEQIADNFFHEIGFDLDMVPKRETLEEVGELDAVKGDLYPESV